ncbi:unnamed protein product [Lathyrus sativus]|nr:unnamed protein product [Lathyrus sativus]
METVSKISSLLSLSKPKLIHHTNSFLFPASNLKTHSSSNVATRLTKKKTEAALAKEKRRTHSDDCTLEAAGHSTNVSIKSINFSNFVASYCFLFVCIVATNHKLKVANLANLISYVLNE